MSDYSDLINADISLIDSLFGSSSSTLESGTSSQAGIATSSQANLYDTLVSQAKGGTETSYLEIDQEAVDKILADLLGGTGGLADIFSKQGAAGLYSTPMAAQASGDLIAKTAGEIAKLTAKQVKEFDTTEATSKTGQDVVGVEQTQDVRKDSAITKDTEDGGLFGWIFG